jgi:hypothetical protein
VKSKKECLPSFVFALFFDLQENHPVNQKRSARMRLMRRLRCRQSLRASARKERMALFVCENHTAGKEDYGKRK